MSHVRIENNFTSADGSADRAAVGIDTAALGAATVISAARGCLAMIGLGQSQARLSVWQERTAKKLMMDNLEGCLPISAVAKECCLSRSHFSRAFKNSTGHCPRDWLRLARLSMARELLQRTDFSISQVGLACGFADQPHFTRAFSKKFGVAPGKWRIQAKARGG